VSARLAHGFSSPKPAAKQRSETSSTMNTYQTPTEILAAKIADLEAKLQLADERAFYLVAQVAQLNAKLGRTDYRTKLNID
jgi:hypothetical protein